MRTDILVQRLYGPKKAAGLCAAGRRPTYRGYLARAYQSRWVIVLTLLSASSMWIVAHVHYYNLLVDLECNVQAAWAQVEASQQRRHNIQENLRQTSAWYAQHEAKLFTTVTQLRTEKGNNAPDRTVQSNDDIPPALAAAPPELTPRVELPRTAGPLPPGASSSGPDALQGLNQLGAEIDLVAEQYPQLMLSKNMQQFSTALVDIETQVTDMAMRYNDAVNVYTTALTSFPSNVFGVICGFKTYEFFTPDKETLRFQEVEY